MTKYMLLAVIGMLISVAAGCTTEKHYPAQAPTVIHEDQRSSSAAERAEAREGARQGAREAVQDDLMRAR
ncbi:MAG TPA: hypothetical protein VFS39_05580 [Nitrospira sp.]|nr:hypothetical protein [Nitrospira sp.]